MRRRLFLLSTLAATLAPAAHAIDRPFPETVKRGVMAPGPFPQIVIDGSARRMTPGAQIRNEHNLIVTHDGLPRMQVTVNYTETEQGEIDRVWVLTPAEANRPVKSQRNTLFR